MIKGQLVRYIHPGSYSYGELFIFLAVRKVRLGREVYYQVLLKDRHCDSTIICRMEHIEEIKEEKQ